MTYQRLLLELRFLIAKRMYDSHIVTKESKRSLRETFFHLSLKPDIIIYNCWMFRWTPTKRKLLGPGCAIINLSVRPSVCLSEVTSPGHTFSPLCPFWLILHLQSAFGWRVWSDLEPSWRSNIKVIAELPEKSLSRSYILSLWSKMAHTSPTECPWSKGVQWPW